MGDEMKANGFSKWAVAASAATVLGIQAMGRQASLVQTTPAQTTLVQTTPAQTSPAPKRVIVVSLEDRKLALVEDGQLKKIYTVAVGKPSTPSPAGTFTIERRVKNPVYRHDGKVVQPGPGNPVGTRWMGLNIKSYGIHGTNAPRSIGKAASHGCIRMGKADIARTSSNRYRWATPLSSSASATTRRPSCSTNRNPHQAGTAGCNRERCSCCDNNAGRAGNNRCNGRRRRRDGQLVITEAKTFH